jgi:RecJ-like exonuclease
LGKIVNGEKKKEKCDNCGTNNAKKGSNLCKQCRQHIKVFSKGALFSGHIPDGQSKVLT